MKRNSKGMLSIIVMVILALSFAVPLVSVQALDTVNVDKTSVQVGDTITVSGPAGQVTSGATIKVFWDIAMGDDAWLLNTTTGDPDGSYDVEIDVPDSLNGTHYVWVEDTATQDRVDSGAITVNRKVSLDPDRGLADDEFEVEGTGFSEENEITLTFWNSTYVFEYSETPETDEYGTFTVNLDVPGNLDGNENYGKFYVNASDDVTIINATDTYDVGASITVTPDEGPEGTLIELKGEGFSPSVTLSFGNITWANSSIPIVDDTIAVGSNGKFTGEIVVPSWGEGEYNINVSDGSVWADEEFEIDEDGGAEIEVEPTYGPPGAIITVKGYNFTQIADTEISLNLNDAAVTDLGDVDVESDGTFETTFVSPAIDFDTYKVWANDTTYLVNASDTFKVGIIAFIIHPTYGEAGTNVGITGIGFEPGSYNLTFGDELYEDFGTVSAGEAISDPFYVPNVEPGSYDILVSDSKDNELTVQFMVTESTRVEFDPPVAPNDYNVSIDGYNFGEFVGDVDFVLWNSTEDWVMDVYEDGAGTTPAATDIDGNFTGWWMVLDEDDLSLGEYIVNITGPKELLWQGNFSIVEARVDVEPRKMSFDRGDSIQFDIANDFKLPNAYIEIYSPDDVLYWVTEEFDTDWWKKVEGLYTVPYYRQTAAGNPIELQSDAPMGDWLYIFYDNTDTELMNGTFTVGPSQAAQIDERLSGVESSLAGLADDIAGVTSEIEGDIGALASDLADIASEVDDLRDDIVSDLADDIAAAADAADAATDAVQDLEETVGDIADVATDAKSAAESAASAADSAATAAEDAKTAATGLTTLVYGAIGASLIAALAAIVSLMQISRKIA